MFSRTSEGAPTIPDAGAATAGAMVAPGRRGRCAGQNEVVLRAADREAAPKALGKATAPSAPPAPEAPGKALAGGEPGGAPAFTRASSPHPPTTDTPASRDKRGRRAASKGTAAPVGKAPAPGKPPPPATAGAPAGREEGGR